MGICFSSREITKEQLSYFYFNVENNFFIKKRKFVFLKKNFLKEDFGITSSENKEFFKRYCAYVNACRKGTDMNEEIRKINSGVYKND